MGSGISLFPNPSLQTLLLLGSFRSYPLQGDASGACLDPEPYKPHMGLSEN